MPAPEGIGTTTTVAYGRKTRGGAGKAGKRSLPCYDRVMAQRASKRSASSNSGSIVLGRSAFKKISAVEGIQLSRKSEALFAEFDRNGLSAEERRLILLEKHAKKA